MDKQELNSILDAIECCANESEVDSSDLEIAESYIEDVKGQVNSAYEELRALKKYVEELRELFAKSEEPSKFDQDYLGITFNKSGNKHVISAVLSSLRKVIRNPDSNAETADDLQRELADIIHEHCTFTYNPE